jgi:hypothetical protein
MRKYKVELANLIAFSCCLIIFLMVLFVQSVYSDYFLVSDLGLLWNLPLLFHVWAQPDKFNNNVQRYSVH